MINFKKLKIWELGIELVESTYQITTKLPISEIYGLTNQMRRCSVSIPSNIAEGCSRQSEKDKARFVEISMGSSFELETQIHLCLRLNYISEFEHEKLLVKLDQIQRMINSYLIKLRTTKI
ncbi:MAG: four helix bundle protein [Bacteroidetes bacterium]|nr:four helix bundle protein [Bacteroidota bacterium]